MSTLQGKTVLLMIGGGIAAYKSLDLIRRLRERGAAVRAILTQAGSQFVTPLSVSALTGEKVFTDLFDLTDEAEMGHIQLSRSADLIVVAPATADLMARMAQGLANDLATTALLATDTPVLLAPAMNVRMWTHPATQRNIKTLQGDGIKFVGPNDGDMACGEFGPGRMAEPLEIVAAAEQHFSKGPLAGKHVVITSGPTHEPIDPVRYIANRSSGKQGHAIAAALRDLGASVTLVSGPVSHPAPAGVTVKKVETARDMLAAVEESLPADAVICAAAVADWRTDNEADQKLKKVEGAGLPTLSLTENPDILRTIGALNGAGRPALIVGFAAETHDVVAYAEQKRQKKCCDWIVANDVSGNSAVAGGVMGGDHNQVHLVTAAGVEDWPVMTKHEVAAQLALRIATQLGES